MNGLKTGRGSEGGHWYTRSGECCYEIMGSNGQMRSVTLRDARKLGLVPGFSAIAAMEAKPQLERWKIEQALMAALTLPRIDGESDQSFMQRAREDSFEQARRAAERGTSIHAAIQGWFEGKPVDALDAPYVYRTRDVLFERFGESGWVSERSFAHRLGYGGKVDLHNHAVTADVKCKDFDESKKAEDLAWPEMCMQLTAYSEGLGKPNTRKANVFVSTRVPGLVLIHEWNPKECADAWEAFKLLLRLWQIRRNYNSAFGDAVAA